MEEIQRKLGMLNYPRANAPAQFLLFAGMERYALLEWLFFKYPISPYYHHHVLCHFFSFSGKIEPNVLWFPFLSFSFFSNFSLLPACLVTGKMRVKEKINLGDLPCYFFDDVCLLYLVILDCLVAENCLIWIYIYSARHVSFSVRK